MINNNNKLLKGQTMAIAEHKNAKDAYDTVKKDIDNLIGFLINELTKSQDEITWGQVGSLQHVRSNLIETLAFLSGIEVKQIEESLEELPTI